MIREMKMRDVARLAELTTQLGYPMSPEVMLERVKVFSNNPYGKVFLAEQDGTVVGYISLWIREHFHDEHRAACILVLVVDIHHQRLGIGKKLMTVAEEYAKEQGCISLDLTSAHQRKGAHAFYEGIGYAADQTKYFSKDIYNDLTLKKAR